METISVLLVDDHAILREGIRKIFAEASDIQVVGEAIDGKSALGLAQRIQPDVILLDISLPGINGLETLRRLRETVPHSQVVILTMHEREAYVMQALDAGALGYVLKGAESQSLLSAIRAARRGEHYLCPLIRGDIIKHFLFERRHGQRETPYDSLSEREQQVFRLLAEGHATRKVAELLCISPKTVEKHRINLMRKLAMPNMVALVKYAVSIGLVDVEPR